MAPRLHVTPNSMQTRRRVAFVLAAVSLLFLPLIAMQFTAEVNWGAADFALGAILLAGMGLGFAHATQAPSTMLSRVAWAALVAALMLIWAHLAVGVF